MRSASGRLKCFCALWERWCVSTSFESVAEIERKSLSRSLRTSYIAPLQSKGTARFLLLTFIFIRHCYALEATICTIFGSSLTTCRSTILLLPVYPNVPRRSATTTSGVAHYSLLPSPSPSPTVVDTSRIPSACVRPAKCYATRFLATT